MGEGGLECCIETPTVQCGFFICVFCSFVVTLNTVCLASPWLISHKCK